MGTSIDWFSSVASFAAALGQTATLVLLSLVLVVLVVFIFVLTRSTYTFRIRWRSGELEMCPAGRRRPASQGRPGRLTATRARQR